MIASTRIHSHLPSFLVHGGFVDGSGWEGVYGVLRASGYKVAIVQNPTPFHSMATSMRRGGSSTPRKAKFCWSAIPMAGW